MARDLQMSERITHSLYLSDSVFADTRQSSGEYNLGSSQEDLRRISQFIQDVKYDYIPLQ
jgi:hypothetical protein